MLLKENYKSSIDYFRKALKLDSKNNEFRYYLDKYTLYKNNNND
jgi:hypothetical protein